MSASRYSRSTSKKFNTFKDFIDLCVSGNVSEVKKRLTVDPNLAIYELCTSGGEFYGTALLAVTNREPFTEDHLEIGKLLVEKGADKNATSSKLPTPLSNLAHICGSTTSPAYRFLKYLLEKNAHVNKHNNSGHKSTPLHMACQEGREDAVELLVKYGANVNEQNEMMVTPFSMACGNGHTKVVKFLLENTPVDITLKSIDGLTVYETLTTEPLSEVELSLYGVKAESISEIIQLLENYKRDQAKSASFNGMKLLETMIRRLEQSKESKDTKDNKAKLTQKPETETKEATSKQKKLALKKLAKEAKMKEALEANKVEREAKEKATRDAKENAERFVKERATHEVKQNTGAKSKKNMAR